jgi:hypothetical protein
MALNFDADPHRVQLKFGTEGLPAREELLLKSLIRILDYRTLQQWTYQPESADVWLLAEGASPPQALARNGKPVRALIVSANANAAAGVLVRPLRSDQVEVELNRIGTEIAATMQAAADSVAAQPATSPRTAAATVPVGKPAGAGAAAPVAGKPASAMESFQLIRWPSIHLLGNSQRIRLSTIMLGRPLTLAEIMQRSHLSESYCLDFLSVLKTEGLVVISLAPLPAAQAAANPHAGAQSASATAKLSLFARIRNRLTLKNPTPG